MNQFESHLIFVFCGQAYFIQISKGNYFGKCPHEQDFIFIDLDHPTVMVYFEVFVNENITFYCENAGDTILSCFF